MYEREAGWIAIGRRCPIQRAGAAREVTVRRTCAESHRAIRARGDLGVVHFAASRQQIFRRQSHHFRSQLFLWLCRVLMKVRTIVKYTYEVQPH